MSIRHRYDDPLHPAEFERASQNEDEDYLEAKRLYPDFFSKASEIVLGVADAAALDLMLNASPAAVSSPLTEEQK